MRLAATLVLSAFLLAGCSDDLATKDYLAKDSELPAGFDRSSDEAIEFLTEGWATENPGRVDFEEGDWPFADVPVPAETWAAAWGGSTDGSEDGTFVIVYAMRFADNAGADALVENVDLCDWFVALRHGSVLVGVTGGDLIEEQDLGAVFEDVASAIAQRTGATKMC